MARVPLTVLSPAAQVRKIVNAAYARTLELLTGKRDLVTALANALLEKEARPPRSTCL